MLHSDFLKYIAQTSPESMALEVERAEGVWLYGPNGRKMLDLISGICVMNVGHSAPEVVKAVQKQAACYMHPMVYGEVVMSPQVRLAQKLLKLTADHFGKVYFTNSGAEAIEGALKVAKKFTGRGKLISFEKAYHGSTHGALSVGGKPESKQGYGPLLPNVHHLKFNDFGDLEKIDKETAAVLVEPIQGAAGYVVPDEGYLPALRQRCDEVGALLLLDEIQTGFGRTGSLFAYQQMGFIPDILILAKALGGGMPLGAFLARDEVLGVIQRNPMLGHISTYGGHPVSCAAGLAALKKLLDEELIDRVAGLEKTIRERLRHPAIREVRGKGLALAVIFEDLETTLRIWKACLARDLVTITFLSIDNGLRIAPPLTISDEELNWGLDRFLEAVEAGFELP